MTAPKAATKATGRIPLDQLAPIPASESKSGAKTVRYWIGKMPNVDTKKTEHTASGPVEVVHSVPTAPCQIVLGGHDFPGEQSPIVRKAGPGQEQARDLTYGKVVDLTSDDVEKIREHMSRSYVRWRRRRNARDDYGHQITLPSQEQIKAMEAEAKARNQHFQPPPIVMQDGDEPVHRFIFMQKVGDEKTPHGRPGKSIEQAGGIELP